MVGEHNSGAGGRKSPTPSGVQGKALVVGSLRASEEVILQLVKSKCMPMLLYGLECFALLKSDVKSIDFAVTRFLMKLFRTSNIDTINDCRSSFNFLLPSEMIEIRNAKIKGRFNMCNSLRYYFGL